MRFRVSLLAVLPVISALLLSSCAPTSDSMMPLPLGGDVALPVRSVAIVADACVARDEANVDYYYVTGASRSVSSFMLRTATEILEEGHYEVESAFSPFVGGFLELEEPVDVASEIGGGTRWATPPFFVSPALDHDREYASALAAVLKQVAGVDIQGGGPLMIPLDSASLPAPDWELLRDRLGTDYVLVVAAGAVSVSGGKQTGEFCLSSCLSMVWTVFLNAICSTVTGGDPVGEVYGEVNIETPSHLRSAVQLFDTGTGEVVWTCTMTHVDIDPTVAHFYGAKWGPDLRMRWFSGQRNER